MGFLVHGAKVLITFKLYKDWPLIVSIVAIRDYLLLFLILTIENNYSKYLVNSKIRSTFAPRKKK